MSKKHLKAHDRLSSNHRLLESDGASSWGDKTH